MKETMEEVVRAHILVRGKVQGVGFRAFTQYQATFRKLQGWVRNCAGGEVELEIEGPNRSVDAFLQAMRQGPPLSQVLQVTVDWKEPNRQTEGFKIIRSSLEKG
jgi:acylphosphatase